MSTVGLDSSGGLDGGTQPPKKYLVLLGVNGTLCYRDEVPIPGAVHSIYLRRKYYYARHGIDDFVRALHESGFFEVCVYSSMKGHNIEAVLAAVLPSRHILMAMLDRSMNKPDLQGVNEWDTVRDMPKVWRKLPGFGPKRTVLLDHDPRKFQEEPRNGILLPEVGPAEVLGRKSDALEALQAYLLEMASAAPADLRDYMEAIPFEAPDAGSANGISELGEFVAQRAGDVSGVWRAPKTIWRQYSSLSHGAAKACRRKESCGLRSFVHRGMRQPQLRTSVF